MPEFFFSLSFSFNHRPDLLVCTFVYIINYLFIAQLLFYMNRYISVAQSIVLHVYTIISHAFHFLSPTLPTLLVKPFVPEFLQLIACIPSPAVTLRRCVEFSPSSSKSLHQRLYSALPLSLPVSV